MSEIIQVNHRLERLVKNPHFKKQNPFDYSKGGDNPIDEALQTGKLKGEPLFRDGIKTKI